MEQPIVKIQELTHRYHAGYVLQGINISIPRTGVMGLLGVNGAGKSTIMNILCGVLTPTSGKLYINGVDITTSPETAKKDIGFLPQTAPLHTDLTIDEYLTHAARMRKMPSKEISGAVAAVKHKCHLSHYSKRLIGSLSGGYRQRVGIAQAIIHRPALVVFDEPTNGLDPLQILEVRNTIREIATERTVLFSSHILSEVALLCQNVLMIDKGKLVFSGTMEQFGAQAATNTLIASFEQPPIEDALKQIEGVAQVEWMNDLRVRINFTHRDQIARRLIEASCTGGWTLQELYFEQASLNETFARFIKSETPI